MDFEISSLNFFNSVSSCFCLVCNVCLTNSDQTIHFNFDNHYLTKHGKNILDQNIKLLADNPEIKLTIEGHASARGAYDYNQSLSEKRAYSVRDYMTSVGKISPKRLSIVGYGSTKPKLTEPDPSQIDSPEAKENMRVELKVIKY